MFFQGEINMEKLSKEEKELVLYCLLGGVNILSFFEMFSAINTPLFIFYEWSYFVSLVMLASAMPVSGTLKAIKKS